MSTARYNGVDFQLIDDSMAASIDTQLDAIRNGNGTGVIDFQGSDGTNLRNVRVVITPGDTCFMLIR